MPRRFKTTGSWGAACGVAWYAHGGTNGHPWGAMRIAMPDCRGGYQSIIFAVFAKIPPPIPSPPPRILSRPPFPVVIPAWSCRHRGVCSDVARRIAIKITASRSGFARDQILCPLTDQAQRPSGSSLGLALPVATRPPFAFSPNPLGDATHTRGRGGCGAANRPTAAGAWRRCDRGSL